MSDWTYRSPDAYEHSSGALVSLCPVLGEYRWRVARGALPHSCYRTADEAMEAAVPTTKVDPPKPSPPKPHSERPRGVRPRGRIWSSEQKAKVARSVSDTRARRCQLQSVAVAVLAEGLEGKAATLAVQQRCQINAGRARRLLREAGHYQTAGRPRRNAA